MLSIFGYLHFALTHYIAVLQKQFQGNFGTFQGSGKSWFSGSENDCCFLKIPKWQHKLVWDYKRWELHSYFVNNAVKTCLYGLEISGNIEIEHVFQTKVFFHLNTIFTQVASGPLKSFFHRCMSGGNFCVSCQKRLYNKIWLWGPNFKCWFGLF